MRKIMKPKKLRVRIIQLFFIIALISRIGINEIIKLLDKTVGLEVEIINILPIIGIGMGVIFSMLGAKRTVDSILMINNFTKQVTNGNYDIRLNEKTLVIELNEMANNFNEMAKQLSKTEMFRKDFISNVSHEFKTPVAAIEGYASLLENKALDEEKRQEYIKNILYNTKRLNSLTSNILLLSNIENTEKYIETNTYSLDEQIRQSILLYEKQWSEKNIELDIELDEVNYHGNEEMLMQVWNNLISNAIKFSDANSLIKIKLKKYSNKIEVKVKDSGIGMSEEVRERIFEKFYQGDTSHTIEGNGLGLNIVLKIIQLHKGKIKVNSEENKGSEFIITLTL